MARPRVKRRRAIHQKAIDQGYLKDLYLLIIKPLLRLKPKYSSYKDWVNHLLHADTRSIEEYEAIEKFNIPGLLYMAGDVVIQGVGHRVVPLGTRLWVRHDTTQEDRCDVEICVPGRSTQIFRLTDMEWLKIKNNLVPWQ